jgi:DNA-binding NarL/FixJ family response regulator
LSNNLLWHTSAMSPITISLIDPDRFTQDVLAQTITASKGELCLSSCHDQGETACHTLPRLHPQIVFVEVNLTGLNGIESARWLKLRIPTTHFVMLATGCDTQRIFEAISAGATGYLLKPVSPPSLLAAISDLGRGGSPLSSQVARRIIEKLQSHPEPDRQLARLSPREIQVLSLLSRGCLYKEIAESLKLSIVTVNAHVRHIYDKLQVRSRGQATARFLSQPRWQSPP